MDANVFETSLRARAQNESWISARIAMMQVAEAVADAVRHGAPDAKPTPAPAPDVVREALEAVDAFWSADALGLPVHSPDDPDINPQCAKVWRKVLAALAALDTRKPETLGWGALSPPDYGHPIVFARDTEAEAADALKTLSPGFRIVRLVAVEGK